MLLRPHPPECRRQQLLHVAAAASAYIWWKATGQDCEPPHLPPSQPLCHPPRPRAYARLAACSRGRSAARSGVPACLRGLAGGSGSDFDEAAEAGIAAEDDLCSSASSRLSVYIALGRTAMTAVHNATTSVHGSPDSSCWAVTVCRHVRSVALSFSARKRGETLVLTHCRVLLQRFLPMRSCSSGSSRIFRRRRPPSSATSFTSTTTPWRSETSIKRWLRRWQRWQR